MIQGHKPGGYFVTADGEGRRIEGETRQCVHCQYVWEYRPGSGTRRGYCMAHNGWLCGREECDREQRRMVALYEQVTRRTARLDGRPVQCLAFDEWNELLMEKAARTVGRIGEDFTMTESGLIVPRGESNGQTDHHPQ